MGRGMSDGGTGHGSSQSGSSPSLSQITVMGLLRIRLRALYLLLAAEGGVRDRPYFGPINDGDVENIPSLRAHSSGVLLFRPGEEQGLSPVGDAGSNEESRERAF